MDEPDEERRDAMLERFAEQIWNLEGSGKCVNRMRVILNEECIQRLWPDYAEAIDNSWKILDPGGRGLRLTYHPPDEPIISLKQPKTEVRAAEPATESQPAEHSARWVPYPSTSTPPLPEATTPSAEARCRSGREASAPRKTDASKLRHRSRPRPLSATGTCDSRRWTSTS